MRRGILFAALAAVLTAGVASVPAPPAQAQVVAHDRVVSDDPANFTPHVLDGRVNSIAQVGNTVILGGEFSQVQAASGGPILTRNNIVAFNATTGAISTTFNPSVPGTVNVVLPAADGTSVYLGGNFNNVNGATRTRSLARVTVSNGAVVTTFRAPAMTGRVKDLRLVGNRLWVAGTFGTIANQPQPALATINATNGDFDPYMGLTFAGPRNGGALQVIKIDVARAGDRLIAIGNFSTVGGQTRTQLVMLNISGASAALANWTTSMYEAQCSPAFDSYMRDLDFAPDGSFFVVTTTGAYSGGRAPCDTSIRWETYATGNVQPTWLDFTGGDTTYAVAVTEAAVYTGGHFRWQNNPFAGDRAGAGAVAREGITALDPENGLPLAWNPGRAKGVGVFDMLATTDGLWVGSDTERIGGWEQHPRIAFFPLAGGTVPPPNASGALPGHVFLAGGQQAGGPAPGAVLARVNAGGPTLPSGDAGPDWAGDETASPSPRHNGGSNAAGWAPVGSVDGTVPPTTPTAVFDTERWDPGDAPEMSWDFPVAVPNGTPLQVRLYFAARCDCTNDPGERVFDVNVEGGSIELDNYDIVADVGFNRGTMKAFNISSDGNVDIDFGHGVENPLINAIEILRTDVTAPTPPSSPTDLRDIFFDGDDADPAVVRTQAQTGIDWSTVRGATMLDGNVYTGHADGSFVRRSFNGTTFGAPVAMDLQDQIVRLDAWHTDVQRITGMFFDKGRLYYTITGSASLFYRYFTPENSVVGAARFTASNNVTGIDFARISGMFLAGGKLYFANTLDGNLRSIDWNGSAPVAGTAAVVAGDEGNDWRSRGMFVYTGSNLPGGGGTQNQAPTANASMNCSGLTCQFNGTGSSDPENGTLQYAWTFGDGQTSTAASGTVTYPAAGTYTVRLTVTDPQGASNTTEQSVTVSNSTPPTGDITFVGSSTTNGNWTTYRVDVPAGVAAGDGLLLVVTTGSDVTVSPPAGWTQVGTVAASGSNNGGTTVWRRVAAAGDAGQAVTVTLSAIAKTGVTLLAYHGTSTANPVAQIATAAETVSRTGHTTPGVTVATAGSVVVSYWSDRNSNTTAWTEPAGEVNRAETQGAGGGHISTLATDSNGPVAAGPRAGLTATADAAGARATMVTIVLAPA